MDSTFLDEQSKLVGGILMSLSFMVSLGTSHITVMSKCDLIKDPELKRRIKKLGKEIDFDKFFYNENEDDTA